MQPDTGPSQPRYTWAGTAALQRLTTNPGRAANPKKHNITSICISFSFQIFGNQPTGCVPERGGRTVSGDLVLGISPPGARPEPRLRELEELPPARPAAGDEHPAPSLCWAKQPPHTGPYEGCHEPHLAHSTPAPLGEAMPQGRHAKDTSKRCRLQPNTGCAWATAAGYQGSSFPALLRAAVGHWKTQLLAPAAPKKSPDGAKHTSPGGHPTLSKWCRNVASPQPLWAQLFPPLPLPAQGKHRSLLGDPHPAGTQSAPQPPGGRQRRGRGRAAGARLFPPAHPEESPRTHLRAPDPLSRHGSAQLGTARGRAAGRGRGCRAPPARLGSAPPSQKAKIQPGMASQGPAVAKDPPCAPPDSPAARPQHPPAAPRPPGVSPSLINSPASARCLLPLFFPGFFGQNLGSPCQHPGCRPSPERGARRRCGQALGHAGFLFSLHLISCLRQALAPAVLISSHPAASQNHRGLYRRGEVCRARLCRFSAVLSAGTHQFPSL